jgi:hypothetical protein
MQNRSSGGEFRDNGDAVWGETKSVVVVGNFKEGTGIWCR